MNHDEYKIWAQMHAKLFPSWGSNRRSLTNAKDVSDLMHETLEDLELVDCIQASKDMFNGSIDKPIAYDDHLLAVRHRAYDLRATRRQSQRTTFVDGERAFRCVACEDSGWRYRAKPQTLKSAQEGAFDSLIEWWTEFWSLHERGESIKRSRPVHDMYGCELIPCDCDQGRAKRGGSINTTIDCEWFPSERDSNNLIACRDFTVQISDLTNAVAEYQNG